MGQRGIHPLLHTMRVVMRNGASFNVETTMFRPNPYMLQVVSRRGCCGAGLGCGVPAGSRERLQTIRDAMRGTAAIAAGPWGRCRLPLVANRHLH